VGPRCGRGFGAYVVIGTRSNIFLTGAGMEKRSVTLRDWRWKEEEVEEEEEEEEEGVGCSADDLFSAGVGGMARKPGNGMWEEKKGKTDRQMVGIIG